MSAATTGPHADNSGQSLRSRLYWALADGLVLAKRNLVQIPRIPELLIFATIQPVMFVLLFRYVFGGAIDVGSQSYVNYLMAGIFAQTVAFGSMTTGIGLAEDLSRGLIDRFRSLPMARSAVLVGRTFADLVRNMFVVAVMLAVGLLVGFRPGGWRVRLGSRDRVAAPPELRILLDSGDDRAFGTQRRGGAAGKLRLALSADLCKQRFRAYQQHARLAPRLRRAPADHTSCRRGARFPSRRARGLCRLASSRLVCGYTLSLRTARGIALPAHDGSLTLATPSLPEFSLKLRPPGKRFVLVPVMISAPSAHG